MQRTERMVIARLGTIRTRAGRVYSVQACGLSRADDGIWEGWVAFFDSNSTALHTGRETVQPGRAALEYWASGLGAVYLEGALDRAVPTTPEAALLDYAGGRTAAGAAAEVLSDGDLEAADLEEDLEEEADLAAEDDGAVDAASGANGDGADPSGPAPAIIATLARGDGSAPEMSVRGRVVAIDAVAGRLKLRAGRSLLDLVALPADLEDLRIGQVILVTLPLAR